MLGTHPGIIHFTVGQRRGLGVADAEPLYVVKLDAVARRVIVGPREALKQSDIAIENVNWLGDGPLSLDPQVAFAKIRSTRPPVEALVRRAENGAMVTIPGGEHGVSPGQACVLYDGVGPGARVLGGGFISLN